MTRQATLPAHVQAEVDRTRDGYRARDLRVLGHLYTLADPYSSRMRSQTAPEIAEATGIPESSVRGSLYALVHWGHVTRAGRYHSAIRPEPGERS